MTYGDKYLQLYQEYIDKQNEYISELHPDNPEKVNFGLLSKLSSEATQKRDTLEKFASYMKVNSITILDEYIVAKK